MFEYFLAGAFGWFMSVKYEEVELKKKQNEILTNIEVNLSKISRK